MVAQNVTPRTAVLESYFQKYPETPREVILKIDLLGLGHWFSDAALAVTEGALIKSYRLFSYDYIPMADMRRKEHLRVPEHFFVLGGAYDLRPVMVQTSLSPDSPYLVDVVDGRLVLTTGGEVICEVRYQKAPDYYGMTLADGTPYGEVIAFGFFVTAFRNCQYWGPDEECKFCDINFNAHQMSKSRDYALTAPIKAVEAVAEVARAVEAEAVRLYGGSTPLAFLLTGGTIKDALHGKAEEEFYGEYVEALKWGGARRFINLQTNARPKEVLRRFRAMGVDSHHANMEVWDRRLFDWIAPGKAARVGRDQWIRWLVDSVDVFGEGAVKPIFVCGVEMARPHGFERVEDAVASTTEGIEFLMSHGVIPRFNQWRREPRSHLVREAAQPPIPVDFYVQLMRNRYEIWKKYKLPLPLQKQLLPETRHLGVSHGTHEDYILLMEGTYPPDIVDLVNSRSTPFRFD